MAGDIYWLSRESCLELEYGVLLKNPQVMTFMGYITSAVYCLSALTLLVGCQEEHLACKRHEVLARLSVCK